MQDDHMDVGGRILPGANIEQLPSGLSPSFLQNQSSLTPLISFFCLCRGELIDINMTILKSLLLHISLTSDVKYLLP